MANWKDKLGQLLVGSSYKPDMKFSEKVSRAGERIGSLPDKLKTGIPFIDAATESVRGPLSTVTEGLALAAKPISWLAEKFGHGVYTDLPNDR
jgi:hypothetical protein